MIVAPMRAELVRLGFQELRTPDQVDAVVDGEDRPLLLVVNSICGCAAGATGSTRTSTGDPPGPLRDAVVVNGAGGGNLRHHQVERAPRQVRPALLGNVIPHPSTCIG